MTPEERIAVARKQKTPAARLTYFFSPDFPTWKVPIHAVRMMDENYHLDRYYSLNIDKFGANPLWSAVAGALAADLQNREHATDAAPYIEPWWVADEQPTPPIEIYKEMADERDQ